MVNAHLSIVPQQGESEQRRRSAQPEQQVQPEGQRLQPDAPPDHPHPVVDQAQQHPQQRPLPKDGRLGRNVGGHGQRSSRDRKPPRPPPASSS